MGKQGYYVDAQVKIQGLVWEFDTMSAMDTAYIKVDVTDSNEPPVPRLYSGKVVEGTADGRKACFPRCGLPFYGDASIRAKDEDIADQNNLIYEITSGNTGDAFEISDASSTSFSESGEEKCYNSNDVVELCTSVYPEEALSGFIVVKHNASLNFEIAPFFSLTIKVTDRGGNGAVTYGTASLTLTDRNDLPRFCNRECSIAKYDTLQEKNVIVNQCSPETKDQQPLGGRNGSDTFGNSYGTIGITRTVSEFAGPGKSVEEGGCANMPDEYGNQLPVPDAYLSGDKKDRNWCGGICAYDDDILGSMPNPTQSVYYYLAGGSHPRYKNDEKVEGVITVVEPNDVFRLNFCNGKLMVATAGKLDYEGIIAPKYYDLKVFLYDDHKDTMQNPEDPAFNLTASWGYVRVEAQNENDRPTWPSTLPTILINESTSVESGAPIGNPLSIVIANMEHTIDVDQGDVLTWKFVSMAEESINSEQINENCLSKDPSKAFTLDTTTGQLITGQLEADYECDVKYAITVEVTDSGLIGGGSKPLPLKCRGKAIVDILDRNDPPKIEVLSENIPNNPVRSAKETCLKGSLCRTVPENSVADFLLDYPLTTKDPDKAALNPTFELMNGTDKFQVLANGSLMVLDSDALNFEDPNKKQYVLLVSATDQGRLAEKWCQGITEPDKKDLIKNARSREELTEAQRNYGEKFKAAVQEMSCDLSSGSFVLTFQLNATYTITTDAIAFNNNKEQLKVAIQAIFPDHTIAVTTDGTQPELCASTTPDKFQITFTPQADQFQANVPVASASVANVSVNVLEPGVDYYKFCESCITGSSGILSATQCSDCDENPTGRANATYETTRKHVCEWLGGQWLNELDPPMTDENRLLTIIITNVNESPELDFSMLNTSVEENSPGGTNCGRLNAEDPDNENPDSDYHQDLSFYVLDKDSTPVNCNSIFCVDEESGAVSVAENAIIDYEDTNIIENKISVSFQVIDSGTPPAAVEKSFSFTITNANDYPIFCGGNQCDRIIYDETATSSDGTRTPPADSFVSIIKVVDVDGQPMTFEVYNRKAGVKTTLSNKYEIQQREDGNGITIYELHHKENVFMNYEQLLKDQFIEESIDVGYSLRIFATDNNDYNNAPLPGSGGTLGNLTTTHDIDIQVLDVDEPPRWTGRNVAISCDAKEGFALASLKYTFDTPVEYLKGAEDDTCCDDECYNTCNLTFSLVQNSDKFVVSPSGEIQVKSSGGIVDCTPPVNNDTLTIDVKVCNHVNLCVTSPVNFNPKGELNPPNFTKFTMHGYSAKISERPYSQDYSAECPSDVNNYCSSGDLKLVDRPDQGVVGCAQVIIRQNGGLKDLYAYDNDESAVVTYQSDSLYPQFCILTDKDEPNSPKGKGTAVIALAHGVRLDYETTISFTLNIAAYDNTGQLGKTQFTIHVINANDAPCAIYGSIQGECPTLVFSINETKIDGTSMDIEAELTRGYDSMAVCQQPTERKCATCHYETTTGASCTTKPYWTDQDAGDKNFLTFRMCAQDKTKDDSECVTTAASGQSTHSVFLPAQKDVDNTMTITLKQKEVLDFESNAIWETTVVVQDNDKDSVGSSSTPLIGVGTVFIHILDMNEPPSWTATVSEFNAIEIDVLTQLSTIVSVDNREVLCKQLIARDRDDENPAFKWDNDIKECEMTDKTKNEKLGEIHISDPDVGSDPTVTIINIEAINHSGELDVLDTELLEFDYDQTTRNSICRSKTCILKRTTKRELYEHFDAEVYQQIKITFRLEEAENVCQNFVHTNSNCQRHFKEFNINLRINNINDIVVTSVKYDATSVSLASDQHILNTVGGESITISGFNFGNVTNVQDPVKVEYGSVANHASMVSLYMPTDCARPTGNNGNSNTDLTCTTVSGFGRRHSWTISYHNDVSNPSIDTTSYGLPEIQQISYDVGKFDPHGEEANTITIQGKNLGSTSEWQHSTVSNRLDYVGLGRLSKLQVANTYKISVEANLPRYRNNRCGVGSQFHTFSESNALVYVRLHCDRGKSKIDSELNHRCNTIIKGQMISSGSPDEPKICQQETRWILRGCYKYNTAPTASIPDLVLNPVKSDFNADCQDVDDVGKCRSDAVEKCAAEARKSNAGNSQYFAMYKKGRCQIGLRPSIVGALPHTIESCAINAKHEIEDGKMEVYQVLNSVTIIDEASRSSIGSRVYYAPTKNVQVTLDVDLGADLDDKLNQVHFEIYTKTNSLLSSSNISPKATTQTTREKPNNFDIAGGQYISWKNAGCTYAIDATNSKFPDRITCPKAPKGVGGGYLATIVVGGQISNAVSLPEYQHPKVIAVTIAVDELDTRGGQEITITGTGFHKSSVLEYRNTNYKNSRTMVVTDCTLSSAGADIGTSLKCSTAAGQGTELEFRVVSGDYKGTSICGDANIELDLAKRKTNCVGPCLYICHTCMSTDFLFQPSSKQTEQTYTPQCDQEAAKADPGVKLFGDKDWWASTQHMGCWLHSTQAGSSQTIEAKSLQTCDASVDNDALTAYTSVLRACALKARRKKWWGFSVKDCQTTGACSSKTCSCMEAEPDYFKEGVSTTCRTSGNSSIVPEIFIGGSSNTDNAVSVYQVKHNDMYQGPQMISKWFATKLRYKAPKLKLISGANMAPTEGGTEVLLDFDLEYGYGVQIDGLPIEVRYGKETRGLPLTATNCIVPDNGDQIRLKCNLAPGAGKDHSWRASFGGPDQPILSNVYGSIETGGDRTRYAPPVLEGFEAVKNPNNLIPTQNFNTSGGQLIIIKGKNFGPDPRVDGNYQFNFFANATWGAAFEELVGTTYSNFFVPEADCHHGIGEKEHSELRCKVPEGIGAGISWEVTIDEQVSVQPTTAYGKPIIENVILSSYNETGSLIEISSGKNIEGMLTTGQQVLTFEGRNFGSDMRYFKYIEFGCSVPNVKGYRLEAGESKNQCKMIEKHRKIQCKTKNGVGTNLRIVAVVGGQQTPESAIVDGPKLSFAVPTIHYTQRTECTSRLTKSSEPFNCAPEVPVDRTPVVGKGGTTKGGYSYEIIGEHFGNVGDFIVSFNGLEIQPDIDTEWSKGGQRISFNVPSGSGTKIPIQVMQQKLGQPTTCDQHSLNVFYSYSEPKANNFAFTLPDNPKRVELSIFGPKTIQTGTDIGFYKGQHDHADNGGSFGVWPYYTHTGMIKEQGSGSTGSEVITTTKTKVLVHQYIAAAPSHAADLPFYEQNASRISRIPVTCEFKQNETIRQLCQESCSQDSGCNQLCTRHDFIDCSANGIVRGTFVVHTSWDEGVWWSKDMSKETWTKFHPKINRELEELWQASKHDRTTTCDDNCLCTSDDDRLKDTIEQASYEMKLSKDLNYANDNLENIDFSMMKSKNYNLRRMCGQTSKPQAFSSKNPVARDICIVKFSDGIKQSGTWLRAGTECVHLSDSSGSYANPSTPSSSVNFGLLDVLSPKIPTNPNPDPDPDPNKFSGYELVIFGDYIVENAYSEGYKDVKIILDFPLLNNEVEGTFAMVAKECFLDVGGASKEDLDNVFGALSAEGKCDKLDGAALPIGCTVRCRLPPGNGQHIDVLLKRGESQTSKTIFTVNYKEPQIVSVQDKDKQGLLSIDTIGLGHQNSNYVLLSGQDFGLNPRVSLQSKRLNPQQIYATADSTGGSFGSTYSCSYPLVPAYDMNSGICVYSDRSIAIPKTTCDNPNDVKSCQNILGATCGGQQRCFLPTIPPISSHAVPAVWDDNMLLVGTKSGRVYCYKRNSDSTSYDYINNGFSSIQVRNYAVAAKLSGDPSHLVVGTGDGLVIFYKNNGTIESPIFADGINLDLKSAALSTSSKSLAKNARISIAVVSVELNGLKKNDLIVGDGDGNIWYFQKDESKLPEIAYKPGQLAKGDCKSTGRASVSLKQDSTSMFLALIDNSITDNSRGIFKLCTPDVRSEVFTLTLKTLNKPADMYTRIEDFNADEKTVAFDTKNKVVYIGTAKGKIFSSKESTDGNSVEKPNIEKTSNECDVGALSPSHTCIQVEIPPGIGRNLKLELTSADQSHAQTLHFKPPTLDSQVIPNIDTRGYAISNETIRIRGKNFGASRHLYEADLYKTSTGKPAELTIESPGFGWTAKSWLQGSGSLIIESWNHEFIEFRAPIGDGKGWPIQVTVGGQTTVEELLLAYHKPSIESISPNEAITSDGRTGVRIDRVEVKQSGAAIAYLLETLPIDHPQFEKGVEIRIVHNNEGVDYDSTKPPTIIDTVNGTTITFKANLIRGTGNTANFMPGNFSGGFMFVADRIIVKIKGSNFGHGILNVSYGSKLKTQSVAWCPSLISSASKVSTKSINTTDSTGSTGSTESTDKTDTECLERWCDADGCELRFTAPAGVGKQHQVSIIVGGQQSIESSAKTVSYMPPILFRVKQSGKDLDKDQTILRTDGCKENQFKDWDSDKDIAPRCNEPIMLEIYGVSLGSKEYASVIQLNEKTLCGRSDLCQGCVGDVEKCEWENPVPYPWSADRPVVYLSKEALKSRDDPFSNDLKYFKDHTTVRTLSPTGIGIFQELSLYVGAQYSNNLTLRYAAPDLKRLETMPYNARGQYGWSEEIDDIQEFIVPTTILGWNFGPASSNVALTLGGRHCCIVYLTHEEIQTKIAEASLVSPDGTISECAEGGGPKWIEKFEDPDPGTIDFYGHPYIGCRPPRDVVGSKEAKLTVAGQSIMLLDGLVLSRCFTESINNKEVKYYGTAGQLCAVCPTPGANCVNGSKEEPLRPFAQAGFWRLALNIQCEERSGEDGYGPCIKFANVGQSIRALGKEHPLAAERQASEAKPRCPKERWDLSLRREYPNVIEEKSCYDFAGCRPKAACTGNNTCDIAYQWTMKMCLAWESGNDMARYTVPNPLESGSGKGIGNYRCVTNSDCRTRSGDVEQPNGGDNRYTNPEDGAICVNQTNITSGAVTGFCHCKPAERCALCTTYEYYQFEGECIPCPENPALIFIIFGVAIIGAIIGGKVLSHKRFNLAFISIGVDYFQVLALFAYSKIKWPPLLKQIMLMFSVFNFNADLTAPECLLPNLEYEHKWYGYQALPLVVTFILALYVFLFFVWKRFVLGQKNKKRTCSHASPIVGVQLILMYYLYMMLTRRIFYVFNCVETDPADGYEYTEFTSIECEGGMCRCWNPGGVHERLISYAIPAIFVYVIGFPLYIFYIVKTYKKEIKEDQLLRAQDLGDTVAENPFAHHVRVRYHRIYYHFKPSKTYWFLYVIFRKFWIVMVGVVLREQPGFQLSVTQLVLFGTF